jgi:hypothetical protein
MSTALTRLPSRPASLGWVTKVEVDDGTLAVAVARAGQRALARLGAAVDRALLPVASCAGEAEGVERVSGRLAPAAALLCSSQQTKVRPILRKPSIFPKPKRRITWAAKLQDVKLLSTNPERVVVPGTSPAPALVPISKSATDRKEALLELRDKVYDLCDRHQRLKEAMEKGRAGLAVSVPVVAVTVIPPAPRPLRRSEVKRIRAGPPAICRRPIGCDFDITEEQPVRFPVELLGL